MYNRKKNIEIPDSILFYFSLLDRYLCLINSSNNVELKYLSHLEIGDL